MPSSSTVIEPPAWEHFEHGADIGVRGFGRSREEAFANAALALTAVIADLDNVVPREHVRVECEAPDDELLFVDWLNAVIFEMATRNMLFSRYQVTLASGTLAGELWGEPVDRERHAPAVEVKGATYTDLAVRQGKDRRWVAQCIVDV